VGKAIESIRPPSNPVGAPSDWTASDLHNDRRWIRQFTRADLSNFHFAATALHNCSPESHKITETQLLLHTFGEAIEHIRDELDLGRGITLLRGLNVEDYSLDLLKTLYLGLGSHLGTVVPQTLSGDLLRSVTDVHESEQQITDDYQARGHRGRAEMLPHSDSADVVGLLCVRPAKKGGSTTVCSAAAIYSEIAKKHPEYLGTLCGGFFFDMTGKTTRGVSDRRLPVFGHHHGRLFCQFNKNRIEVGMKKAGVLLEPLEIAALDYLSELALRPDFALRFDLQAGDLLFLNNQCTLHARDEYEDWPDPNRKRLLLRLWVNFVA
jgi:hypothetical protein